MTKLRISPELALPIEAVTEAIGFLGRRGSGKTYAAQKLVEEFHRAHAQFVVLDPVGNWWSLRLAANGVSPGIPVPVFGGLHGDVPLEPTAGKMIADLLVDRGISAVVDVSQFESDADKARFATDFGARFYYRKKAAPSAVHLVLEECQEFVPQNPQKEETRMLHAYTRIVKLGRNFGIGVSMLSQRPQEVNKKVLNLTELLLCFQLTGPQERKTVDGWISEKGIDEDISGELPKLARGTAHAWSPAWLTISKVVAIGEKWTLDASSTPTVGTDRVERELSPIDLEQLRVDMAATIEKAKADDPKELRKEIATLRTQLTKAQKSPAPASAKTVVDQKAIERAVGRALDAQAAAISKANWETMKIGRRAVDQLERAATSISDAVPGLKAMLTRLETPVPVAPNGNGNGHHIQKPEVRTESRSVPRSVTPRAISTGARAESDTTLGKGERKVLTAIAQYPDGADREQLTVLTGYKRSSRDTYIQRLQAAGYVETSGGAVLATDAGVDALGADFEPLPTGEALREYWLDRLTGGERAILGLLIDAEGEAVARDALTESTGYKRSSRDTYLQRLAARKLVVAVGRGEVKASVTLFDEARR